MAQQATFERLYFASGRVKFPNSKEITTIKMAMKMVMDDGDGYGPYMILAVSSSAISKK